MGEKIIDPFTNISNQSVEPSSYYGSDVLSSVSNFQLGAGDKSMKVDKSGMWFGSKTFATAPFKVDLDGNVTASSLTAGNYVQVGGAAADVNNNSTQITGVRIQDGTIFASKLSVSSLSAISANLGTITAGSISGITLTLGSGNNTIKMDPLFGIWAGHANFNSSPFRVNMSGQLNASQVIVSGTISSGSGSSYTGNQIADQYIQSLTADKLTAGTINAAIIAVINLSASNITTGSLDAAIINVLHLNADNITTGQLTVGTGGATAIRIKRSGTFTNAIIKWDGNSAIWVDSSDFMGLWATGGQLYLWCGNDSDPRLVCTTGSSQNSMYGGLFIHKVGGNGGNLNVEGNAQVNGEIITTQDHIRLNGGTAYLYCSANSNIFNSGMSFGNGKTLTMSSNKTAIVPTSNGYRALYCNESPEVWFMDFAYRIRLTPYWMFWNKKYKYSTDPLFKEVTSAPYHFLPTVDENIVQVWGKRKGHETLRFEKKTKQQFLKNENFWRKPN